MDRSFDCGRFSLRVAQAHKCLGVVVVIVIFSIFSSFDNYYYSIFFWPKKKIWQIYRMMMMMMMEHQKRKKKFVCTIVKMKKNSVCCFFCCDLVLYMQVEWDTHTHTLLYTSNTFWFFSKQNVDPFIFGWLCSVEPNRTIDRSIGCKIKMIHSYDKFIHCWYII